jgi:hypothetical protein
MKVIFVFIMAIFTTSLFAHCPALFKVESVCFMLAENTIYIYDQKFEHNGPYKDLKVKVMIFKDSKEVTLPYKKIAAGVYKLDTPVKVKELRVTLDQARIYLKE